MCGFGVMGRERVWVAPGARGCVTVAERGRLKGIFEEVLNFTSV